MVLCRKHEPISANGANSGAQLHLIQPLGFSLDVKSCRRAGLDYLELVDVTQWPDFQSYRTTLLDLQSKFLSKLVIDLK